MRTAQRGSESEAHAFLSGLRKHVDLDESFPFDLDDLWSLSYASKGSAKKLMKRLKFKVGSDYQVVKLRSEEHGLGRGNRQKITLSASAAERFLSDRFPDIGDVFRDVFQACFQRRSA